MIIDSSALVAVVMEETGWEAIRRAIVSEPGLVPAPVVTEVHLVCGSRDNRIADAAQTLIATLPVLGVRIISFEHRHADITAKARNQYGKGNGRGGLLNFGDLMVYAIAKDYGQPLLCTGRDFSSTDLIIHPASRLDG